MSGCCNSPEKLSPRLRITNEKWVIRPAQPTRIALKLLSRVLNFAKGYIEGNIFPGKRMVAISLHGLITHGNDVKRDSRTVLLLRLKRHARLRINIGWQVIAGNVDHHFLTPGAESIFTVDRNRFLVTDFHFRKLFFNFGEYRSIANSDFLRTCLLGMTDDRTIGFTHGIIDQDCIALLCILHIYPFLWGSVNGIFKPLWTAYLTNAR